MISTNDEDIESIQGGNIIRAPNHRCSSGHKIERFCSNRRCCSEALCCSIRTCKPCYENHEECLLSDMSQLTAKVEKKLDLQKNIIQKFFEVENNLLNHIITKREELLDVNQSWRIDRRLPREIYSIYFNRHANGLTGAKMYRLFNSLSSRGEEEQAIQKLEKYREEGENIIENLITLRRNMMNSLIKIKPFIDSKIFQNDNEGYQKANYLLQQLDNPLSLRLLFRASQHNFEANQFHRLCNDISKTVTIIRTEHGKTIAGYTPIKWVSSKGSANDRSNSSFLLQLELRQKYLLKQQSKAVYSNREFGPTFGCNGFLNLDHDIRISDRCNEKRSSKTNFPTSYHCGDRYQNSQQKRTALCGVRNENQFIVTEYEVFEVID